MEKGHVWKLHAESDLGVKLGVSAMDFEGCYVDPDRRDGDGNKDETDGVGGNKPNVIPPLHPDDEALIHWKGSLGDTSAEQLQQKRDRARAAARLAIAQGHGTPLPPKALLLASSSAGGGNNNNSNSGAFRLKKKHHLQSRIIDEKTPNFMKKTTYLTNDATSVHRFTSLAHTQEQRARDVDRALAETKEKYNRSGVGGEGDIIEKGFREANAWEIVDVLNAAHVAAAAAAASSTSEEDAKKKKKQRLHPTKKDVFPVWDLPLLPDVVTWGHTYTHVVLDNPPKSISANATSNKQSPKKDAATTITAAAKGNSLVNASQLQKAIVADVTKQTQNARMACTVWVPSGEEEEGGSAERVVTDSEQQPKQGEPPAKKAKKGDLYKAVQRYDLDVVPLRDASGPPVHFVLTVDPTKKYVGYHPVGSRVQLSTGRPVVLTGSKLARNNNSNTASNAEIATDKSLILRRAMELEEKKDMEKRMAEVDVDMAEKYGLIEDEFEGNGKSSSGSDGQQKKKAVDSDDEMDEDAL